MMEPVELARRLTELLRARGLVTDAQLGRAGELFQAGHPPARCLELAGVPRDIIGTALAELSAASPSVASSLARTEMLGSGAGAGTELLGGAGSATEILGSVPGQLTNLTPGPNATAVLATGDRPALPPSVATSARPARGEVLGGWTVERALGEGGMAAVSLARDAGGRYAAVKVVHAHLLNIPEARARFLREIDATRKIHHKNIVEVLDVSAPDAARAWLAVEFVDGGSVADLLRIHGRLPLAVAIEIFTQMLEGLEAAHALHVVHRDLKPDNLLLSKDGVVKLADFGIARELDATAMTQTGSTLGTPAYMSPEQARAQPVDGRSDLYTAGVILFELLTGKNPFIAESLGATVANILMGRAPPLFEVDPTIPEPIDELVGALLRGDPGRRPPTAGAVRAMLLPFLEDTHRAHPRLLAEILANPAMVEELRREQARDLVVAARLLLQMGAAQRESAGLCLMRARLLDEGNAEAVHLLQALSAHGVSFAKTQNPKVLEVEQQLAAAPDDAILLQRAAQLWRQEGNVYKAAVYFRRYLRVRPDDQYVAGQLSRITSVVAGSTMDRIAGHIGTSLSVASAVPAGPQAAQLTQLGQPQRTAMRSPAGDAADAVVASNVDGLRATWSVYGKQAVIAVVAVAALVFGWGFLKDLKDRRSPLDASLAGAGVRPGAPDEDAATRELEAARAAFSAGNWEETARVATAVLNHTEKPSRASTALLLRGRARLGMNKQLSAVEDLSRVVDAYRSTDAWEEALVRRGQAYAASGDTERAFDDFSKALGGNLSQPLMVLARMERGAIHAARGDAAHAREDLEKVRTYSPPGDPSNVRAKELLSSLPAP